VPVRRVNGCAPEPQPAGYPWHLCPAFGDRPWAEHHLKASRGFVERPYAAESGWFSLAEEGLAPPLETATSAGRKMRSPII
jgi:hypothetical protein